jgi:putative ABC transport system permease protein
MFSHIFKLIWKKKRSSFLLMLEIFFSFLVLFAVCSAGVHNWTNYRKPAGIEVNDRWVLTFYYNNDTNPNIELVKQRLKSYPEIQSFSYCSSNFPYSQSQWGGSIYHQGQNLPVDFLHADEHYQQTLGLKLSEGRWVTPADTIGGKRPVLLTQELKDKLFKTENSVGKKLRAGKKPEDGIYNVVGVVANYKYQSDFQGEQILVFQMIKAFSPIDLNTVVLHLKPGANIDFEARLSKDLARIGKEWTIEISHLDKLKNGQNRMTWIPLLIAFIVCGFLVLNVALGLFGVLFQNIQQRRGEIGVRRAMGATKVNILGHFIGETAMIATFSLILGLFFAVQFPLLRIFDLPVSVYVWGMVLAVLAIYLLVVLCAFLPSKQASNVFPANALREA